jgi:ubiquinone/menaquinone biosynthesis C-methylase UbiE
VNLTVEEAAAKASREAAKIEPWPGYYMVRGLEIGNLLGFMRSERFGRVLDIGCGNGFTSYLISQSSFSTVACDLYHHDARTHSPGLDEAKKLFEKLGELDIPLVACSTTALPFKDNSFDTVFAGYVLQYLKEKPPALGEMRRVVKKDGIVVLMLPNFIERIYGVLQFYAYLAVRAFAAIADRIQGRRTAQGKGRSDMPQKAAAFIARHSYFPFPGPHGAYRNSAVEMARHTPFCWSREFRRTGFNVVRSFTTTYVPYPLLLTFSVKTAAVCASIFNGVTRFCGAMPVMKYLGYNYCVVLKR